MLSILWSKKTKAVLQFKNFLDKRLCAEYGKRKYYTKEQIAFIVATMYPQYVKYIEFALYIYMTPEDFERYNQSIGELYNADDMGKKINFVHTEEKDTSALRKDSRKSDANTLGIHG
ncbi:hypothetical protein E2K93_06175 [Thalassotalea sp. HSM 43]|uniref:hypothetical protein n=1 Tax=Thalassotalea sp. HSM 43 TaxID=2552945 RepID=UPI0010817016|nr:hypothetical protein [Thalassotalea sp. HSM 43]QBY03997.1 hypothetical protein E2K93_06175 [Thalassotalea sp. HSM 43]